MIKKLITSLIGPKLEQVVIWSPYKRDIKKIERIQRAATEIAPSLRDLPYKETISRLKPQKSGKKLTKKIFWLV